MVFIRKSTHMSSFTLSKNTHTYVQPGFSQVVLVVKNLPVNAGDTRMQVWSMGREDPTEEGLAIHSVSLPGKLHGERSLTYYSPWGHKELDMTVGLNIHTCNTKRQAHTWLQVQLSVRFKVYRVVIYIFNLTSITSLPNAYYCFFLI